ncbi:SGNH/GDSL hydrolase family protein [Pseudonocardia sp. GCM10023141]|uniref:SGNH/GDSL hydrolase family protein n=1 Tax=Pseudonocardia sp. GCM10023141 TaxID=3252653 RepID=UPI003606F966
MPQRLVPLPVLLVTLALATALTGACAQPAVAGRPAAAAPAGPVTVITLGDSLTSGDGDDDGQGYAGRMVEMIAALPGREGSTLVNLGQSGWDSTMLVNGQEGSPGELAQALEAVRAAPGPVLATILIGSNDLWLTYQNGTVDPTPRAEEDAAVAAYRANLDRTIGELRAAGAAVVVGLPDDQSRRVGVADIATVNAFLPNVTVEEVGRMAALAKVIVRTAGEVAAARSVPTVDTDDPFWTNASTMAADRLHPNGAGYAVLAQRFMKVVTPIVR